MIQRLSFPQVALISAIALLTVVALPDRPSAAQAQGRAQSRQLQQGSSIKEWPGKAKRWALIIGVDKYRDTQISSLNGAANDAHMLKDALVSYASFPSDQVILLATDQPEERQPTRINILTFLSNLASLVPKDGLLLVSFAGHGIERGGQAYLIPSDARLSDDVSLLEESAVNVTRMHDRIRNAGMAQVVILLDACRNDPGGRADAPNLLTPSYTKAFNFDLSNREVQAFATLYATAIGQRAYEYSEKKQGYFTWAIVEGLKGGAANEKGEVTLAQLLKYVQENVPKQIAIDLGKGKQQRPFAVVEGYKAEELIIAVAPRNGTGPIKATPAGGAANSKAGNTPAASSIAEQSGANGDKFRRVSQWSKAEMEYRVALRMDGNNADWHARLGEVLSNQRKLAVAETELRAAIQLEVEKAEWHDLLGVLLSQQRKYNEAEVECRLAVRLEPDNGKWHAHLAQVLRAEKRNSDGDEEMKEATRLSEAAARAESSNAELWSRLGEVLSAQGKWAEAEVNYRLASRLEPNNSAYHQTLAAALRNQRKWADAEVEYKEALRLDPNTARYHLGLGLAFVAEKKFAEAEAEYREAARLETSDPTPHNYLGFNFVQQNKQAEAEAEFRTVLRLDPNDLSGHFSLGNSLEKQNKLPEAEAEFRETIRLDPNFSPGHISVGRMLGAKNKWPEAEAEYREAVRLVPQYELHRFYLAYALAAQKKYGESETEYREAIRLNAGDAAAHNNLGDDLEHENKLAEAEVEYREAVRLDPAATLYKSNLDRVVKARQK